MIRKCFSLKTHQFISKSLPIVVYTKKWLVTARTIVCDLNLRLLGITDAFIPDMVLNFAHFDNINVQSCLIGCSLVKMSELS